jgi:hypothetical protein
MKRRTLSFSLALALAAVGGCATAGASHFQFDDGGATSRYSPARTSLADADLQAAANSCTSQLGGDGDNIQPTRAFRDCMLGQGWRYRDAIRDGQYDDPWHAGRTCRDFFILGTTGTRCQNF